MKSKTKKSEEVYSWQAKKPTSFLKIANEQIFGHWASIFKDIHFVVGNFGPPLTKKQMAANARAYAKQKIINDKADAVMRKKLDALRAEDESAYLRVLCEEFQD